jgi:hypothetical protein
VFLYLGKRDTQDLVNFFPFGSFFHLSSGRIGAEIHQSVLRAPASELAINIT